MAVASGKDNFGMFGNEDAEDGPLFVGPPQQRPPPAGMRSAQAVVGGRAMPPQQFARPQPMQGPPRQQMTPQQMQAIARQQQMQRQMPPQHQQQMQAMARQQQMQRQMQMQTMPQQQFGPPMQQQAAPRQYVQPQQAQQAQYVQPQPVQQQQQQVVQPPTVKQQIVQQPTQQQQIVLPAQSQPAQVTLPRTRAVDQQLDTGAAEAHDAPIVAIAPPAPAVDVAAEIDKLRHDIDSLTKAIRTLDARSLRTANECKWFYGVVEAEGGVNLFAREDDLFSNRVVQHVACGATLLLMFPMEVRKSTDGQQVTYARARVIDPETASLNTYFVPLYDGRNHLISNFSVVLLQPTAVSASAPSPLPLQILNSEVVPFVEDESLSAAEPAAVDGDPVASASSQ